MCVNVFKRIQRGLFVATLPIAIGFGAHAEQLQQGESYIKDVGGAERVNYSGKLRMLSQRIVATSCNFAAGIDPEQSGAHMRASEAEFELIVDALEFGNDDLGIHGAEERKKTIRTIRKVREALAPVAEEVIDIDHHEHAAESLASLSKDSATLLEAVKLLVSVETAQYSNPASMVQANAMLIDISGRQRMLTQRMSKNICLIASDIEADAAKAELAATAQIFDASLKALYTGLPDVGINPPPNTQIANGLAIVKENWAPLKPAVEQALAGHAFDASDRARVYHGMNQMTANMNTVVGYYAAASKLEGM